MPLLQERASVTVDKILFATDFSSSSEKAAAYAIGLAQRFSSEVEIANVFNPSTVSTYEEAIIGMTRDQREQNANDYLERVKGDFLYAGIRAQTFSSEGHNAAAVLLAEAFQSKSDLIIAGTQSKKGVERMMLGSTAEELIRGAVCPVLTVGPHAPIPPNGAITFRSIVFATDFSAEAIKAAVFALSFAEDSGAHLYFCHVIQGYPGWEREAPVIDASFKVSLAKIIPHDSYDWCTPKCVVEHGEAAKGILGLAEKVHADLIVLGARKETFLLKHHLDHGVTPDLLADATCPILTVS